MFLLGSEYASVMFSFHEGKGLRVNCQNDFYSRGMQLRYFFAYTYKYFNMEVR